MTQTPPQTHSLFDDMIDQYRSNVSADDQPTEIPVSAHAPEASSDAPVVDETQLDESSDQATTDYQNDALAMAEFIEFRGKKMHVTDRNLVTSKIQRFKLSPSTTSSLLDDCPASWAFGKLLPFDDSPFSPAGAGGLAHEALENFYQLPEKSRDGVALAEEIRKVVTKTFPTDAAKGALLNRKLNELAGGIFDMEDPKSIIVDRVEESIDATIVGIPVTGTVDRTDLIDDDDLLVMDYKTGKYRQPDYRIGYERAMRIYTLLKEAQTGKRPVGAYLLFTAAQREVEVDVSEDLLEETKDDLLDAWDIHNTAIETCSFPTNASPLCGWCPLANLCTAAEEAGFGPSQKAIDAGVEFIPADDEHDDEADAETDDTGGLYEGFARNEHPHAGHGEHDKKTSQKKTSDPTPQKDTMSTKPVIIELPPYEMLTDEDELNPNSWAANSLFKLYSRIDEAIRVAHPDFDRDAQHELTKVTLFDVVEVITESAGAWTGDEITPQHGSFTRLSHVADTHIRSVACDFDDEDAVNQWLDDLATELGFATGRVLDAFDRLMPQDD